MTLRIGPCTKKLRNIIDGKVKSTKLSYNSNAFIQSNGNSRKTWHILLTNSRLVKRTIGSLSKDDDNDNDDARKQ